MRNAKKNKKFFSKLENCPVLVQGNQSRLYPASWPVTVGMGHLDKQMDGWMDAKELKMLNRVAEN